MLVFLNHGLVLVCVGTPAGEQYSRCGLTGLLYSCTSTVFNSSFDKSQHMICLVAHIVTVICCFEVVTDDNSEVLVFINSV